MEGAQRTFHRGSRLGSAIIKTITSFVTTGDPRNVAVQVDDDLLTRDGVSLLFRDGMTRYVVAHELGHVYLRHLERDAVSAQQVLLRDPSGPWQDEYEADHFALRVVLDRIARSATEKPRESSLPALMAIEMGLMLRVFVEAAQGYLIGRTSPVPDGEGSHPPADRRFTRYRSAIDAQVGDSRALRQLDFQDAHAMVDLIVWHVLPPLREECLRLRLAGVMPV